MSRLIYIRHAQASYGKADYDQLSELGYKQSRILGDYLVEQGVRFSHIYVGPLKRHRQTLGEVQAAYADAGVDLPEAVQLQELDEHRGPDILKANMQAIADSDEQIRAWDQERQEDKELYIRNGLQIFERAMLLWATGKLQHLQPDKYLDWPSFRHQARTGYQKVLERHTLDKSSSIGLFTSGGTISATIGHLMGMSREEDIIGLNGIVQNTSLTEILFAQHRKPTLHRFNDVQHLPKNMLTYV